MKNTETKPKHPPEPISIASCQCPYQFNIDDGSIIVGKKQNEKMRVGLQTAYNNTYAQGINPASVRPMMLSGAVTSATHHDMRRC